MKILIIEDEAGMRENMISSLKKEAYVVESAADYNAAREKLEVFDYDCVLLDIGLPGGNGFRLLEELRAENKKTGVIIVSARDSIDDKVRGLDLGADDYLAKPFHMAELHARIKSVIRRKTLDGDEQIHLNNIVADISSRTVMVDAKPLELNRKEYDVFIYLLVNKNRLVNKAAIAEQVWGEYIDEKNSFEFVYSQIKNLRKKLKDIKAEVEIQAVYGVGYKLTG